MVNCVNERWKTKILKSTETLIKTAIVLFTRSNCVPNSVNYSRGLKYDLIEFHFHFALVFVRIHETTLGKKIGFLCLFSLLRWFIQCIWKTFIIWIFSCPVLRFFLILFNYRLHLCGILNYCFFAVGWVRCVCVYSPISSHFSVFLFYFNSLVFWAVFAIVFFSCFSWILKVKWYNWSMWVWGVLHLYLNWSNGSGTTLSANEDLNWWPLWHSCMTSGCCSGTCISVWLLVFVGIYEMNNVQENTEEIRLPLMRSRRAVGTGTRFAMILCHRMGIWMCHGVHALWICVCNPY